MHITVWIVIAQYVLQLAQVSPRMKHMMDKWNKMISEHFYTDKIHAQKLIKDTDLNWFIYLSWRFLHSLKFLLSFPPEIEGFRYKILQKNILEKQY